MTNKKEIFVTVTTSDNEFLTYPCKGLLELFETGADGSLIVGVWRGLKDDGKYACPVVVRKAQFNFYGNTA